MRPTIPLMLLIILLLVSAPAFADPITLHNTGLAPQGTYDPNWNLTGGTAYVTAAGSPDGFPLDYWWFSNTSTSRWISPQPSYPGLGSDSSPAMYTFWTTFEIPIGFDPTTASFQMKLAADNRISGVSLNGQPFDVSSLSAVIFHAFSDPFVINTGFLSGLNRLEISVWNAGLATGNPAGLRVEFQNSSMTAVPEPSALALLGVGILGLIGYGWRRGRHG